MQRHRSAGLQQLPIDRAEDPNVVIRSGRRSDDAVVLIDHLHELADDEGHRLYPLDLFLSPEELALEVLELVLDVLLLDVDELDLALERFEEGVEVVLGGDGGGAGRRKRRRR